MARRYLAAFGPATTADFARWWGIPAGRAKKVFQALGDEIEEVDVEGWPAWALTSSLEQLTTLTPAPSVRLLPQFDAYTVGMSRECEPLLSNAYKGHVYRPQGWISAVVLVNGSMAGTWRHKIQGARVSVQVSMFTPCSASIKEGIQAEAQRLGDFLDTEIVLAYEEA